MTPAHLRAIALALPITVLVAVLYAIIKYT